MSLAMPLYFFNLKTGKNVIRDFEGLELPDDSSARSHARIVALELMRNRKFQTMRSCRLSVCDGSRELCFDLLFASIDPATSHLPPEIRASIEDVCEKTASLYDAIDQVRQTLHQVKGTLARSERAPYLAALDGVQF